MRRRGQYRKHSCEIWPPVKHLPPEKEWVHFSMKNRLLSRKQHHWMRVPSLSMAGNLIQERFSTSGRRSGDGDCLVRQLLSSATPDAGGSTGLSTLGGHLG